MRNAMAGGAFAAGLKAASRLLVAGQINPRDRLPDANDKTIIGAALAHGARGGEKLLRLRGQGHWEIQAARHVIHQAKVFDENLNGAARRVIAGQHTRHTVFKHPGITGGTGHNIIKRLRIGTGANAKRHGFRRRRDMHTGEQLMHHLHRGADADFTTQAPDFGGDGITNTWSLDKPLSSTYNVYAIEWFPNKINWYINNKLFHTVTPKSVGTNKWVFNKPFFMILNLAMGGRFTGDLDPDLTSAKMYVDYIRYYTINGQGKVIGTAAAIKAGKP